MWACLQGDLITVKILLLVSPDIDIDQTNGKLDVQSALTMAAINDHGAVAKYLLQNDIYIEKCVSGDAKAAQVNRKYPRQHKIADILHKYYELNVKTKSKGDGADEKFAEVSKNNRVC